MAGPEEKSPKPSADLVGPRDASPLKDVAKIAPIESEDESTMKGNLPPALLAVVGSRPRAEPTKRAKTPLPPRPEEEDDAPESDIVRVPAQLAPAPGRLGGAASAVSADDDDDEETGDSLLATEVNASRPKLPVHLPGSVEIRTVVHDELLDETEVKTVPGDAVASPATVPAAGRPPKYASDDDDSVTTRAPAVSSASMRSAPSTRDARDEPPTAPGNEVPTADGKVRLDVALPAPNADDEDDEDSITKMAPAIVDARGQPIDGPKLLEAGLPPGIDDDSTQAVAPPVNSGPALPGAIGGDDYDGTTKRERAPAIPNLDDSTESVTEQATQVRELPPATPPKDELVLLHDDGSEVEAATKVMTSAPHLEPPPAAGGRYKKPRAPTLHGIAPPADLLPSHRPVNAPPTATVGTTRSEPPPPAAGAPSSESALRVAGPVDTTERANPAAVLGGVPASLPAGLPSTSVAVVGKTTQPLGPSTARAPSTGPHPVADGAPLLLVPDGASASGSHRPSQEPPPSSFGPRGETPSTGPALQDFDFGGKMPRYGLLVGIVAAVSLIVPILLYVVLRQTADPPVALPAELVSVPVKRSDAVRGKLEGRPSAPPPPPSTGGRKGPEPKKR